MADENNIKKEVGLASADANPSSKDAAPPQSSVPGDTIGPVNDHGQSGLSAETTGTQNQGHSNRWLLVNSVILLLLVAVVAAASWFGWQYSGEQHRQQSLLQQRLEHQQLVISELQQSLRRVTTELPNQEQALRGALAGMEQRVDMQSRRLQLLSTTSREDWQLAEAEYLLKLANQRLQIERQTLGALGLLEGADEILKGLDSPELFPVREKLTRDITALKLAPTVDRTGLYLRLAALAEKLAGIPLVVQEYREPEAIVDTVEEVNATGSDWQQTIKRSFADALASLQDQYRIYRHDQEPTPVLPPDGQSYLRQNMRFNLEQAQLAAMKEDQQIYAASLRQALELMATYFPQRGEVKVIAEEIEHLLEFDVRPELPSISGSLLALQDYITQLHLLDAGAGQPMLQDQESAGGQ